ERRIGGAGGSTPVFKRQTVCRQTIGAETRRAAGGGTSRRAGGRAREQGLNEGHWEIRRGDGGVGYRHPETCTKRAFYSKRDLLRHRALVVWLPGKENRPGRQRTGVRNDEPEVLLEHLWRDARILTRLRRPAANDVVFCGVGGIETFEIQSL